MFDIGFSELLLFGVIALIVLGPEKLPQAARTAGQWYAKIRRTVSTLQSEIEAELDLAETRQQMQKELAKIRQTEADMRREMAELRGNIKDFEYSQNQSLNTTPDTAADLEPDHSKKDKTAQAAPKEFSYAYGQDEDSSDAEQPSDHHPAGDNVTTAAENTASKVAQPIAKQPIMTRPWENMWFRLGAYDKARRLPAPPYLPNYQADTLLNIRLDKKLPAAPENPHSVNHVAALNKATSSHHSALDSVVSDAATHHQPATHASVNKQEAD